jgi:membrane-associated phospholipid phosphatase
MRNRPASALTAAALCLAGLIATGVVALIVPVARVRDSATLHGFTSLGGHTRVSELADRLAHSVDPSRYVLFAIAFALVALVRGRPRVAVAVPVTMFAASATTELLKPLVGHPRSSEWLSGGDISIASWPSGHATAAMTVALGAVLVAPRILRPLVALLGTGLAVGVSYSILVLGWHFPSDVLGGFFVAGSAMSLALAGLWWAEARWPERSVRRALGRVTAPSTAVGLLAPAALLAATFGAAVSVLAVRGRLVETYGAAHLSFVAGALAIAGLAAMLATAMAVALRR